VRRDLTSSIAAVLILLFVELLSDGKAAIQAAIAGETSRIQLTRQSGSNALDAFPADHYKVLQIGTLGGLGGKGS